MQKKNWLAFVSLVTLIIVVSLVVRVAIIQREFQTERTQWAAYTLELNSELVAKYGKIIQLEANLELSNAAWENAEIQWKIERDSLNSQLTSKQAEVAALKTQQADLVKEYEDKMVSTERKAEESGYEKGRTEILASGILLKKPTLQELIDAHFVAPEGLTVIKTYIPRKQVCVDFAAGYNNAAVEHGFQVGGAFLVYGYLNEGKRGHFINAFKTAGGDVIYVEPQNHKVVEVAVGKAYEGEVVKEIIFFW